MSEKTEQSRTNQLSAIANEINGYYLDGGTNDLVQSYHDAGYVFTNNLHRRIQSFDQVELAKAAVADAATEAERTTAEATLADVTDRAFFTLFHLSDGSRKRLMALREQHPAHWAAIVERDPLSDKGRTIKSSLLERVVEVSDDPDQLLRQFDTSDDEWRKHMHEAFDLLEKLGPQPMPYKEAHELCIP